MKNLLLAVVCFAAVTCQAQRIATFLAPSIYTTNEVGWRGCTGPTNSVIIGNGEFVRVGMVRPEPYRPHDASESPVQVSKGGFSFYVDKGDVIAGPAVFTVRGDECSSGLLTLEWLPVAVDPGKTLIVPQSPSAVAVAMEWSTNLVHWHDATNGVYGTPDAAKFFRVKASPALP